MLKQILILKMMSRSDVLLSQRLVRKRKMRKRLVQKGEEDNQLNTPCVLLITLLHLPTFCSLL